MVSMIIVYLHSGRQLLLRGEGAGGHFFGQNEGSCAPVFGNSPPTSTSFLEGSSTKRTRPSAPRAGPQVGDSHQPQISDDSMFPQRLCGTCQWLRCWLLVCIRTPALPAYELRRLRQGLAVSLDILLKESTCWNTGAQVGDTPTPPAPPGAADLGRRARGPAALPPAVAPVHTLAALDLSVDPRAPPPGAAPVSPGDTLHVGQGGLDTHWTSSWGSTAAQSRWGSSASSSGGAASRSAAPTCSVAGGRSSV